MGSPAWPLSADGKGLFSASHETIKVWDLETGKETLHACAGTQGVTSLVLSADGKRLFSAGHDQNANIKVWDLARRARNS